MCVLPAEAGAATRVSAYKVLSKACGSAVCSEHQRRGTTVPGLGGQHARKQLSEAPPRISWKSVMSDKRTSRTGWLVVIPCHRETFRFSTINYLWRSRQPYRAHVHHLKGKMGGFARRFQRLRVRVGLCARSW